MGVDCFWMLCKWSFQLIWNSLSWADFVLEEMNSIDLRGFPIKLMKSKCNETVNSSAAVSHDENIISLQLVQGQAIPLIHAITYASFFAFLAFSARTFLTIFCSSIKKALTILQGKWLKIDIPGYWPREKSPLSHAGVASWSTIGTRHSLLPLLAIFETS